MATIACQDCGQQRRGPTNTKYCHWCRLLHDIEYWTGRWGKCHECGQQFNPIRPREPYCGECHPGQTANRGSCALCGEEKAYRVMKALAVCERCARDPEKRVLFIRALRKRIADRLEERANA